MDKLTAQRYTVIRPIVSEVATDDELRAIAAYARSWCDFSLERMCKIALGAQLTTDEQRAGNNARDARVEAVRKLGELP